MLRRNPQWAWFPVSGSGDVGLGGVRGVGMSEEMYTVRCYIEGT